MFHLHRGKSAAFKTIRSGGGAGMGGGSGFHHLFKVC